MVGTFILPGHRCKKLERTKKLVELLIKNAKIMGDEYPIDLGVENGFIQYRGVGLQMVGVQEIDLEGQLLIPGMIDPHVHLDIALTNSWQVPGRTVPYHSQRGMLDEMEKKRAAFNPEDIALRASAALDLGLRHGVTAIRAQCHIDTRVKLEHLKVLLEVKQKYKGKLDLQIVAFPQQQLVSDPQIPELFREAFRMGADVMGCAGFHDADPRKHIETAFDIAMEFDVDLDAHSDLALYEQMQYQDFEVLTIAEETLRRGYENRVSVGHLCALDSADPHTAQKVIEVIAKAKLNVISLPDMYRLGRHDRQHVRRGLTRVKEFISSGVNITFASNNVRDPLRPYGNLNPLEEALILSYGAHMDTVNELDTLLQMCTVNAARALNIKDYGLDVGCAADFVVLDAHSPQAAILNQANVRYVFRAGNMLFTNNSISQVFYQDSLTEYLQSQKFNV